MLFLFVLWAADDARYDDPYTVRTNSRNNDDEILGEDYDDFSTSATSRNDAYPASIKNNYAKGKISAMLFHRLSELFSVQKMRHLLGVPDTLKELRQWDLHALSTPDVYKRKAQAIENATKNLCGLIKIKDPAFCSSNITLIERVIAGTFHDMKTVVLTQFSKLIQSTMKEEGQKLTTLKKKEMTIQQQTPERKRQMLKNKERIREEERRLDERIDALHDQLKTKKYSSEKSRKYDEEALADLEEQKSLLLIEPAHVRHDLDKQEQALLRIKKQKHIIQADIEKFKAMSKALSDILQERETSAELEDAWDEMNTHFEKLEKSKQEDMRRLEKKTQEKADEEAKETAAEERKNTQELQLVQGLGQKSSDPEAAKESADWLSSIGKLVSVGEK